MKMNAKDLRATVLAVATFLIRPSIFLVLGLAVGYGIGYTDAFRDTDTLGTKVARLVYRIRPEAVSEGVYQRASTIRDTMHAKAGITGVIDTIPPN